MPLQVRTAHTAELSTATLRAIRALLGLIEHDWDHALGGMHTMVWEDDRLIAHGAVVQRRLIHGGRALRTGYVEALGVHPDHRGRGHARTVTAVLERVIAAAYDLGALSAPPGVAAYWPARGWQPWQGRTWALTPMGIARTEESDGTVHILPGPVPLDVTGELICDWRDGDIW
ncbi:GNAT family N-acetyltransferase [Streptomyces xiamenensis]|uniref:Aminoglycoside 2'-N-acetyltransferase Aac n=1 Tax=Streptomyces xiamenensis TaxID=408015 RepID=A0A0F7FRG1_9ACTN|nr:MULTISPECIES: GNAT family N-acetyltransferase [Streptomyces]AKG42808.1 aminoglycoside 2'-N-acetyltransferase Aac [Streptomyces xiamenensis]